MLVSRHFDKEGTTYCKFEVGLRGWNIRVEHQNFLEKMIPMSGGVGGIYSAELGIQKSFCIS